MEYRRYENSVMLRLDPDEELLSALAEVCNKEQIHVGLVTGLGAVKEAKLGVFDPVTKEYYSSVYTGMYEIASLTGNISEMNGEPYLHIHAVIGNPHTGECHGGHLNSAVISATGELVITVLAGMAGRRFDEKVGLNLLEFEKEGNIG